MRGFCTVSAACKMGNIEADCHDTAAKWHSVTHSEQAAVLRRSAACRARGAFLGRKIETYINKSRPIVTPPYRPLCRCPDSSVVEYATADRNVTSSNLVLDCSLFCWFWTARCARRCTCNTCNTCCIAEMR